MLFVYAVIVRDVESLDSVSEFLKEIFVTAKKKVVCVKADCYVGNVGSQVFDFLSCSSRTCTRQIRREATAVRIRFMMRWFSLVLLILYRCGTGLF